MSRTRRVLILAGLILWDATRWLAYALLGIGYVACFAIVLLILPLLPRRRVLRVWRRWRLGLPARLHASRIEPTTWTARP